MWSWLAHNAAWVFSGFGVAIPLAALGWWIQRRRIRKSEDQHDERPVEPADGGRASVGRDGLAQGGDGGGPSGGRGGDASVGRNGVAIGGQAGDGGPGARGGDGGSGHVRGEGSAMGGKGGEAGQADRSGKGGRSPFETMGVENVQLPDGSWLWDKGRGGDGAPKQTDHRDGLERDE